MSAPAQDDSTEIDDYDAMLSSLDAAIEQARDKIENGRVYDEEKEKVRVKWIRALAYAINVRRQVKKDQEIEELAKRVDEMENKVSADE